MWPDLVSNLRPLALESDALMTVLCGPAISSKQCGQALFAQLNKNF